MKRVDEVKVVGLRMKEILLNKLKSSAVAEEEEKEEAAAAAEHRNNDQT